MYAQKKSIDNTHIVRERDRQRNRELLAVLSLGVPIGFFLLLFAWQNLEVIRLGREASQLQKSLKEQETVHKSLQAELDRLTSFDTVEQQVVKLGFETTPPVAIVMVERSVGDTAPIPKAQPQERPASDASTTAPLIAAAAAASGGR